MAKKQAPVTLSDNLTQSIRAVWNVIGSDLAACCEEAGESIDNEAALESCVDADRMSTHIGAKGKQADEELALLIKQHGYDAVMKTLKRTIRLV